MRNIAFGPTVATALLIFVLSINSSVGVSGNRFDLYISVPSLVVLNATDEIFDPGQDVYWKFTVQGPGGTTIHSTRSTYIIPNVQVDEWIPEYNDQFFGVQAWFGPRDWWFELTVEVWDADTFTEDDLLATTGLYSAHIPFGQNGISGFLEIEGVTYDGSIYMWHGIVRVSTVTAGSIGCGGSADAKDPAGVGVGANPM